MTDSFKISFKLKNAYRTNGIIYTLKSTPLIKKLLPSTLYGSKDLKTFANVISVVLEVLGIFVGKALYLLLMVILPLNLMGDLGAEGFLHMLVFLTAIGGILNTHMFSPSKDKYYAMFLMRMDAREYTLSNYFYFLIKTAAGFLPWMLLFGIMEGVPLWACFAIPLFIVAIKCISSAWTLRDFNKNKKVKNENHPVTVSVVLVILLLAAAYLPPYLGYVIPMAAFYGIFAAAILLGAAAIKYILDFKHYREVYKGILTPDTIIITTSSVAAAAQKKSLNKISISADQTSLKTGYAYFNDIFVKRHKKLLTRSAKRIALIELAVLAAAIVCCFIFPDIKADINELMLNKLPYFLFIMYFLNRGKNITQAMFMNCDHSMLTYRFYRQPKIIVSLFAARLKSVVVISLIPAIVIALGLPILLLVTGGTDNPLNYLILFISIIAMSIFFSVHNMVMYYLLQPYTVDLEMKNPVYGIISWITYMVCYTAMGKKAPTLVFGAAISAFCIIYVAVALVLAYRLAPRTFKLRGQS
jgi:hypothetical protein